MTPPTDAPTGAGEAMHSPPRENLYRADFNGDLKLRDTPDGNATLFGHFSRFNEWTEINSVVEGRFMERIADGAFTKTFGESRQNMRVLFQHGKDVLGQQVLGPIDQLREDDQGAYYEVPLYEGVPQLIVSGLRGGAYGSSFRFQVMKEDFVTKPKRSDHNPEGIPERTVTEAAVREFGPVTFPAYVGATAGLRSLTDDFLIGDLVDNPDRLLELVNSFKERQHGHITVTARVDGQKIAAAVAKHRNGLEPEPSEATTPTRKPERSVATTPTSFNLYTGQKEQDPTWRL